MMRLGLAAVVLLAGCFDSLVSGPCAAGYDFVDSQCIARTARVDGGVDGSDDMHDATIEVAGDAAVDGGDAAVGDAAVVDTVDAMPADAAVTVDAGPVCVAPDVACSGTCVDLDTDPANCGSCGHVCASGICSAGACVGGVSGHIVAIGHDYQSNNAAMLHVLGNALGLGAHHDLGIARLRGTSSATSHAGTSVAMSLALMLDSRPFHTVTVPAAPTAGDLASVDVLLVEAQTGDDSSAFALGGTWAAPIDAMLQRGGVVIVLEGASGVSYRFADGAGLYLSGAPIDATGTHATVNDANDAVAQQVVSPYRADTTSVVFPSATGPISTAGGALVLHRTRY